MRYDTVIFDLDGTLLNTLADLTAALNHALRVSGHPEHSMDEVRGFVGDGIGMLIRRALPGTLDGDEEACEAVLQAFKSYYARHNNDATAPYPGIWQMLDALKRENATLAIVSNKNDPNVQALTRAHFAPWITLCVGEREGVRRKPHPDALLHVMRECHATPARTLYVGDSDVDIQTARNAKVDCASVCWGFRTRAELQAAGATHLFATPGELARFAVG